MLLSMWEFHRISGLTQDVIRNCISGGEAEHDLSHLFDRAVAHGITAVSKIDEVPDSYRTLIENKYKSKRDVLRYAYRMLFNQFCDGLSDEVVFFELLNVACVQGNKHRKDKELVDAINAQLLRQYKSDKALNEWLTNDTTNKLNTDSSPLQELPKDIRLAARDWFDCKKTSGRYKGYFSSTGETEITEIQNKLMTEKGDELSLYDILFNLNLFPKNNHSVNLCGIGGSGKTHQILNCINEIFLKNNPVIPFYIPINAVRNTANNSIITYLSSEIKLGSIEEVKAILKNGGANILITCDGFNEITSDELRKIIANDLCQIRQEYKTRILISSRRDHTALFNSLNYGEDQVFVKAEVKALTEKQINDFFKKVNCPARYKKIAPATRKLLLTPQGCVMYADLVESDPHKIMQITSLGDLLHDYIRRILPAESDLARIDEYLKEIAYYMVLNGKFHIYQGELKELIGVERLLWLTENNKVETVFAKEDDGFIFCHQHFRDYYCAIAFAEKIKEITAENISQVFIDLFSRDKNNITTNDEILELTSAFIPDNGRSIQSKIDILRENKEKIQAPFHDNYDFPLRVLIRIYAFSHDNNIAKLNLMNLNLKEVNLSGYKLYNSSNESVILNDASISLNTFLKPGLMTASSTICKYQLENKLYIAAFAATTAMIIDVFENQFEIVRNLPNWGWVNVAYPTLYNGKLAIFLGHRNGDIGVFYPDMIKSKPKQLFIRTGSGKLVPKGNGEIESLEIVNWCGTEYIVFCNSTGDVFYRELYPVKSNECTKIPLCNEKYPLTKIKKAFDDRDWDITCHLTYRKDNNTIIIAFGSMVFCLDGNNGSIKLSPVKIKWNGMNPRLILDVCATNHYLFINVGDAISVLKFLPTGIEIIRELIADYEGSFDFYINSRAERLSASGKYTQDKIDRIKAHEISCSQRIEVKSSAFRFKYFSLAPSDYYPNEDVVLVSLEANKGCEDAYDILPNFYEIHISLSERDKVSIKEQNNEQKLASHSGVYYKQNATVFVATTSDDRSVDMFPTNNEELVNHHIEGAYYGVRDLRFINNNAILCALYDGSVILISKPISYLDDPDSVQDDLELEDEFGYESFEESDKQASDLISSSVVTEGWRVTGVIRVHDDWVWKALPVHWGVSGHMYAISCSYDKTVKRVDFSDESLRSKVMLHGTERILDLYVSCKQHSSPIIWGLSEHYIYNTSSKEGKEGYLAEDGRIYRCFTESEQANQQDNVPIIFYTDNHGSYIGKFTNKPQMLNIIKYSNDENIFIRKMEYKVLSGVKYLILVGAKKGQSYIAIYKHKSEDDYELTTDLVINEENTKEKTTGANAFAVLEVDDTVYFLIANKNNLISLCTFCDNKLDFKSNMSVDAQPLCLDAKENIIFAGLLDGSIVSFSIEVEKNELKKEPVPTIKTHANLYSTPDVNLHNCRYDDEITKKAFMSELSSYFTL